MNKCISLAEWKWEKEKEREWKVEGKLESWLNGADIITALDALWNELYITGHVTTEEEFYALTVPQALSLRDIAKKDKDIILLPNKEN